MKIIKNSPILNSAIKAWNGEEKPWKVFLWIGLIFIASFYLLSFITPIDKGKPVNEYGVVFVVIMRIFAGLFIEFMKLFRGYQIDYFILSFFITLTILYFYFLNKNIHKIKINNLLLRKLVIFFLLFISIHIPILFNVPIVLNVFQDIITGPFEQFQRLKLFSDYFSFFAIFRDIILLIAAIIFYFLLFIFFFIPLIFFLIIAITFFTICFLPILIFINVPIFLFQSIAFFPTTIFLFESFKSIAFPSANGFYYNLLFFLFYIINYCLLIIYCIPKDYYKKKFFLMFLFFLFLLSIIFKMLFGLGFFAAFIAVAMPIINFIFLYFFIKEIIIKKSKDPAKMILVNYVLLLILILISIILNKFLPFRSEEGYHSLINLNFFVYYEIILILILKNSYYNFKNKLAYINNSH